MHQSDSDVLKSLAWPTYFVAFLLVATPALDFLANVWPIRLGEVQWRYGSLALFTGFMLTPLFGVMFALGAATVLGHRTVIRVLSFINLIVAPLIFVLIVFFALDVFQIRGTVPEEGRSVFDTGSAKAAVKYAALAIALGWLGLAGIRATRPGGRGKRKRGESDEVPLVRSEGAATSKPSGASPPS